MQNMTRSVFYLCLPNHSLNTFLRHRFNCLLESKQKGASSSMKIVPIPKFLPTKIGVGSTIFGIVWESAVFIFLRITIEIGIVHPYTMVLNSLPCSGALRK